MMQGASKPMCEKSITGGVTMGLWMIILLVSLCAPAIGVFWWAGNVQARRRALDGDQYDAEEMLVAFGTTHEWV